MRELIVSQF